MRSQKRVQWQSNPRWIGCFCNIDVQAWGTNLGAQMKAIAVPVSYCLAVLWSLMGGLALI
jgi:hypothetical protein